MHELLEHKRDQRRRTEARWAEEEREERTRKYLEDEANRKHALRVREVGERAAERERKREIARVAKAAARKGKGKATSSRR